MAMMCKEIQEWIETNVEQPIEQWEQRQEQRCREEPCNWWMLCLNKLFCWFVWLWVKVVRWIVVTVGKWVARLVCEWVNLVLDLIAWVINLVLSIPVIGGILRTVLNWLTEIVWRFFGLLDFALNLLGVNFEKRMYVNLLIPTVAGRPLTSEATMLPQIQQAAALYKTFCNVKVVYGGACSFDVEAPRDALRLGCDASGFFSDWWVGGSYIEFASAMCHTTEGWRRVVGYGAAVIVFCVVDVEPDTRKTSTVGCSFASTHNYVVVEVGSDVSTTAHELGHACWLPHVADPNNLMNGSSIPGSPTLTRWQAAIVRWSKHCVYF